MDSDKDSEGKEAEVAVFQHLRGFLLGGGIINNEDLEEKTDACPTLRTVSESGG